VTSSRGSYEDLLDEPTGRLGARRAGDVRLGDDPHELAVGDDRQASNLLRGHALERVVERLVRLGGRGSLRADVRDGILCGSRSFATTCNTRSRSVIMPTTRLPSTTGSEPTSSDSIRRAASTTIVRGSSSRFEREVTVVLAMSTSFLGS
jgi:hypothetical protein